AHNCSCNSGTAGWRGRGRCQRMGWVLSPRLSFPNHAHTVVVAISNVDVPVRVHVTAMWPVQSGRDCWPIVASTTPASSSDGRNHASHRVDKTNGVVLGIDD